MKRSVTPEERERLRALSRQGAAKRWERERAKRRPLEPFSGSFLDFMDLVGLDGPSWATWRVHWQAVDGLVLSEADLDVYRRHTGRETSPTVPVREVWDVCGRRSGKSRGGSARAFYEGIRRDYRQLLAPGERAVIPIIAGDRRQARVVLDYLRGLAQLEPLRPYVRRELKESVELNTGVTLEVFSASFKLTRGYSIPCCVADESAFWPNSETSAEPDVAIIGALRPGMANIPGSLLLGLSTPYAARGVLYEAHQRYYGQDDPRVLVWVSDTASMNPGIDRAVIAEAFEVDPVAASSEYGEPGSGTVAFRSDLEVFVDPAVLEQAVNRSRPLELERREGVRYLAAVDPSGGRADAMALAIAHQENGKAVLDLLRARRPPFNPSVVVEDFARILKAYGLSQACGDKYSAEWCVEAFRKEGVTYVASERSTSDTYLELIAPLNAGKIELPDHKTLRAELLGLERRTARSGRDTISHRIGAHDDCACAAALALVLAGEKGGPFVLTPPVPVMGPSRWDGSRYSESGGRDPATYSPFFDAPDRGGRGRFDW